MTFNPKTRSQPMCLGEKMQALTTIVMYPMLGSHANIELR